MTTDRVSTQLRLPADLHDRLVAAADERGVALTWLVAKLLDEALETLIPVDEIRWTRIWPIPTPSSPAEPVRVPDEYDSDPRVRLRALYHELQLAGAAVDIHDLDALPDDVIVAMCNDALYRLRVIAEGTPQPGDPRG